MCVRVCVCVCVCALASMCDCVGSWGGSCGQKTLLEEMVFGWDFYYEDGLVGEG